MKKSLKQLNACLMLSLLSASGLTYAAGKHVHGEANLFIAMEKGTVLVELESPADNILGFEHAPSTDQQKSLLATQFKKLEDYTSLISLNKGECKQTSVDIESPFEAEDHHDGHDHGKHDHDEHKHGHHDDHKDEHNHDLDKHAHHDDHKDEHKHDHDKHDHDKHDHHDHGDHEDTHSDLRVSYSLSCQSVADISEINIEAFKTFNRFEKIQVNWLNQGGQGSSTATPKATTVNIP
jgi:hypothetical protein